jgi:type II secretory pathway pseudopilin PulG
VGVQPNPARVRRPERGETLIETLITVVLLGLLATGIVSAFATNIRISDFDARLSGSEAAVRSYGEAWDRFPYVACTAGSSSNPYGATQPSDFTAPSGYTATVTGVTFWNGSDPSSVPAVFQSACPASGDKGLQSVVLKVQPTAGSAQTLTITKRKP